MITTLLLLVFSPLFLLVILIETVIWWRQWRKELVETTQSPGNWQRAAILITGISDYSDFKLTDQQIQFVRQIGKDLDCDLVIEEPFPYLPKPKALRRGWAWEKLIILYALRNFWQFILATAFHRIYGQDIALSISRRIGKANGMQRTLYCICGSAGAAYALAAAPYLREWLGVNLVIIAYGGVFASVEGFNSVDCFYQLLGEKDIWTRGSARLLLNSWMKCNFFQKAKAENRYIEGKSGCHTHFGERGYLSDRLCEQDQKVYRQLTIDAVGKIPR